MQKILTPWFKSIELSDNKDEILYSDNSSNDTGPSPRLQCLCCVDSTISTYALF